MQTLWQDLRYALRGFARTRGFALLAVVTLGLGIWSTLSVFSIVDSVMLRPLPFHQPDRLVELTEKTPWGFELVLSPPEFLHLKEQGIFGDMAAYRDASFTLTGAGDPVVVQGASVTAELFKTLGVAPLHGTAFTAEEARQEPGQVALIGYGLWQRRFGGKSDLLGSAVRLDGESYTVVGVMPRGFRFPVGSSVTEIWTPLALKPTERSHNTYVLMRLAPGLEPGQAEAQLKAALASIEEPYRHTEVEFTPLATPLLERVAGDYKKAFEVLLAAVGALLLIACANVASMLLAKATGRGGEMALRRALGAGPLRLVRQLLTESLLLSAAGGALGLALTWATLDLLASISPANLPRLDEATVDHRVALFTLAAALATGLLFGLAPALHAVRGDLIRNLNGQTNRASGGRSLARLRGTFVVAQMAMAVLLLISAGLMMRSLNQLLSIDPGVKTENVLTLSLSLDSPRYDQPGSRLRFCQRVLEAVRSIPGVQFASLSEGVPLTGGSVTHGFLKEGQSGEPSAVGKYTVGPDYFKAMGISLLKGRAISSQDSKESAKVIVINQAMASRFWSGEEPLGQRILVQSEDQLRAIVGIVSDVKRSDLKEAPPPEMYLPFSQVSSFYLGHPSLALRTSAEPLSLLPALRERIHSLDADLALINVKTLESIRLDSVAHPRFRSLLLGIFSGLALLLSAVGLYGLLSFLSAQRTREFGIRMALGAQRRQVLALVLRQGIFLVLAGAAIGIAAAFALTQRLEEFLYGVTPTDPTTFFATAALLCLVALGASLLPARRASRTDPALSLRYE